MTGEAGFPFGNRFSGRANVRLHRCSVSKKDGGQAPPIFKSVSVSSLIFALAFQFLELATLPFKFQLVLLNLLVLIDGLIIAPL